MHESATEAGVTDCLHDPRFVSSARNPSEARRTEALNFMIVVTFSAYYRAVAELAGSGVSFLLVRDLLG
jgi:hypothetical protein